MVGGFLFLLYGIGGIVLATILVQVLVAKLKKDNDL